jgi:hypothetical protein
MGGRLAARRSAKKPTVESESYVEVGQKTILVLFETTYIKIDCNLIMLFYKLLSKNLWYRESRVFGNSDCMIIGV